LIAGTAYAEPPAVNASYEVKVNLDPERAPVILADLVHGIAAKPRSVYYYQIAPTPQSDKTIVRARRDAKNKVDIDVKLRGIQEVLAWLLTGPQLNLEGVECEWDIGLAADNTGNLSCDIKVETPNDLSDLDGASVMARLNDSQRQLFEIGTHHPDFLSSLNACEKIATKVYKGYAIVPGCDEATVEVWRWARTPRRSTSCRARRPRWRRPAWASRRRWTASTSSRLRISGARPRKRWSSAASSNASPR
jgi:hypothetical protein